MEKIVASYEHTRGRYQRINSYRPVVSPKYLVLSKKKKKKSGDKSTKGPNLCDKVAKI